MSHFYGTVSGQAGHATRCGSANSGLDTSAASYDGAITVTLRRDEKNNCDTFQVRQETWLGMGVSEIIAEGVVGQKTETASVA